MAILRDHFMVRFSFLQVHSQRRDNLLLIALLLPVAG